MNIVVTAGNIKTNLWIRRPCWEIVYYGYPREYGQPYFDTLRQLYDNTPIESIKKTFGRNQSTNDFFKSILNNVWDNEFNDEHASAARVSLALMTSKMMKNHLDIVVKENDIDSKAVLKITRLGTPLEGYNFIINVEELRKWLCRQDIWGDPDIKVDCRKVHGRDNLQFVREKIKGRRGVCIIFGDRAMNGHATLWTGNDVIEGRGRNYIGNNCTVHFWELKGVKESVIKDAYFAKKEVVVVEQDGQMKEEIHFFPISSSLIGKMVYLIVETKNMSGQKLRVSIQDASDKEVYMVEHAKDLGILNSLDDNEGERHHYVNLERDHADKVIVKFQIGSADRVVFDRLAQKIGSRTGATRFEIVVKTDDEQPVYYGNNTRNKSNEGTFLQAGSDNCFTVGSAIRTTTDAGHGDWAVGLAYFDPGAVDGDHLEKDYALKVEEATARWLQTFGGIDNHRMREGDVDKRPAKRQVWRYTETNLNKSKIFVSFHLDSGSKDGFFIIYPQKPATQKSDETFGEYQRKVARSENGQRLAQFIKDNMVILRPIENAVRVDTRPTQLPVLREFNGEAAVLIELCGIGSSTGRELINNYFNEIGRSIAIGIYKYLFNNEDPD